MNDTKIPGGINVPADTKPSAVNYTVDDEEIIARIKNGNAGLYEVIMRRYNQRLFRIGRAYLKDEEEIEDIIQAVYIKAYEQLDKFENRSRFSTWLIRIFINETLARIKFRNRYSHFDDNVPGSESRTDNLIFKVNDMNDPYRTTINNELKEILEKAVDDLPEKYRTIFVMREIEDMTVAETSRCLNISESNVKVRLNRAKEMLRESLSQYYHFKDVYGFNLIRCNRIVNNVFKHIIKKSKD
ncbi:MAG: RNA polymerase sigma factor [Ignavibacteriales bacterium]